MALGNKIQNETLETNVSPLLFVTGILYVLAAINTGIALFNEGYEYQPVSGPLLLIGLLASILALLGIYSKARDASPGVAKATGVVASLAMLAVIVLLLWAIGSRVGPLPESPAPLAIAALILFIVSFAVGGVTVVRSGIYTPLVGYLLIAEALSLVLVFVIPALVYQGPAPPEATMGIELTQAIILLWAGLLIRRGTGDKSHEAAVGAGDV